MNTKSNQRYQETDKKIQQVFLQLLQEKDLSHTTVQDICKGCGINRSTFYAHYTDVYDLLSKMEHSVGMDIFESFQGSDASPEHFLSPSIFTNIIQHIGNHQAFYRAYLESWEQTSIPQRFNDLFQTVFKPFAIKLNITSEAHARYYFTFFQTGFLFVIKQWLDTGCKETPEELAQILWDSIPHILLKD